MATGRAKRQPPNCRNSGCSYDSAFIWTDIPCAGYPTEAPTGTGERRLAAGNPCLPLPTTPGRAAFDVCEVPATSLAGLSVGLDQDTSIALEDAGEGENGVPFDAFVKHEGDGSYSVAFADRCGPAKLREIALTFELGVHGELCLEDDAFHSFALHDLSNVVAEPAFTSCNGGLGSSHKFTVSDANLPVERRAVAVGYRDYVSALRISARGAVTVKGDADAVCDDPVPDGLMDAPPLRSIRSVREPPTKTLTTAAPTDPPTKTPTAN